jgi:drug/metabolite transporter (DMT)-like permease
LFHNLDVKREYTGLFFTLLTVVYTAGCFFAKFLLNKYEKVTVIGFGLFLNPIGLALMGPVIKSSHELRFIATGIAVAGLGDALVLTPALPTIIEAGLKKVSEQRKK